MKRKSLILLVSTVICALFLGCKEENVSGMWKINSLQKDGISQEICDIEIQLDQINNVISAAGNAGVNNFTGEFILNNNGSISVNNLASTKMMGSPEAMEFENTFIELLNGLSSAKIKDEKLILENKNANLKAEFSKVVQYDQPTVTTTLNSFYDTKWIVSSINSLDSLGTNELYIILSEEELSAFTGINQIIAPFGYNKDDNSIYIGEGAATLALGSDEENHIETNFLQNLYNSQKIELNKNTLLLKDANDNVLITLKK